MYRREDGRCIVRKLEEEPQRKQKQEHTKMGQNKDDDSSREMRGAAVTQAEPDERRECSADVRISLDVPHKVALLVSGGAAADEITRKL